ncbi:hypothetical protein LCGC14_2136270 [marine sediment metagenome]|uniref:AB hydrolase-1 domain-containing protein n=1 Tax=marine sediment metagenome TaxID=412755 RepID=A0A0F9DZW6_9ZZZZ
MVTLNTVTLDDSNGGTAPPLLIAHGLFGSARNWGVLTKRLADRGPVTAVDMRNHGASPWSDDHGYPALASDLAATIAELPGGRADVIGHSMGGKAAMTAALAHPDLVRRLIVADIAPVAYGHSQNHLIRAMREIDLSQVTRRSEADAQLAVHVTEAPVRAFLLQSLDVAGKCWTLNLDVLEAQTERLCHLSASRRDQGAVSAGDIPVDLRCRSLAACRAPARGRKRRARVSGRLIRPRAGRDKYHWMAGPDPAPG